MILPMSADAPAEIDTWSEMERDVYRSPPRLRFSQKEVDEGKIWYRDLGGRGDIEAFKFQVIFSCHYTLLCYFAIVSSQCNKDMKTNVFV